MSRAVSHPSWRQTGRQPGRKRLAKAGAPILVAVLCVTLAGWRVTTALDLARLALFILIVALTTWRMVRQSGRLHAAEDGLLAEQAFFQAVFEYTTDCLFVQRVLPDGTFAVERINAAAAQSLGIAARQAIGRSPRDLFGPEQGAIAEDGLRQCLAGGPALWVEDRDADGVCWEVVQVPIPGATGTVERILVSMRDVTRQKRVKQAELLLLASEEQRRLAAEATNERLDRLARHLARARDRAEQANQAKSRFLTSMSHELRTPLNGILGYAQLLRLGGSLSPSQSQHVEAMLGAGRHLLDMITSVLDLAQIEADKITLHPAEIDLRDLVSRCLDLVRPAAEGKGLTLRLAAGADAPHGLEADPIRLRQVLLNLLGNAVKFTRTGDVEVRLLWSEDAASIRLEVADTGPGIPASQRARLFGAFERMVDESAGSTEGAGLGLAISARLVGAMGGRIGCGAGTDDVGSVFWLEMPAGLRSAEPPPAPPLAPRLDTRLRLLVVDDIAHNRDIACAFLRSAHHVVTSADGGEAAVQAAAAADYDVILMDVRMPEVDGLMATRRIRALEGRRGQVPIIAVTAQAFAEQIETCSAAGMDHHLPKPYELTSLLDAVAAAAGQGRRAEPARLAAEGASTLLPVLDQAMFDRTASYLPPDEIDEHMQALAERGRMLAAGLHDLANAAELEAAADLAHAMAGAAGTFGFLRIADAARRFERAASGRDWAPVGVELAAATWATIEVLEARVCGVGS